MGVGRKCWVMDVYGGRNYLVHPVQVVDPCIHGIFMKFVHTCVQPLFFFFLSFGSFFMRILGTLFMVGR